jgi:hypothetical protein
MTMVYLVTKWKGLGGDFYTWGPGVWVKALRRSFVCYI